MTVGKALGQLVSAAGARADVVAVSVSTDFAHGRLRTVGFPVLLAVLACRADHALDDSFVAAEDVGLPFAACVGCTSGAERARDASANDEATRVTTIPARRAERAAIDGGHAIFAAADEAVPLVARAQGAGMCAAKGGGHRVVSRVQAEVHGGACICLE